MSTADDDQQRAADAHAETVMGRHGEYLPGGAVRGDDIDVPPFLVDAMLRFNGHATAGTLRACRHITAAPALRVTAAWCPDLMVCAPCVAAGALSPGDDGDRRCDACGHMEPDGVHVSITRFGSMLVYFGLCDGCFTVIVGPFQRPDRPTA